MPAPGTLFLHYIDPFDDYTTVMRCNICNRQGSGKLCHRHEKTLMWDYKLKGFRLKKKNTGSRYTQDNFHRSETKLVKIIEHAYGMRNVYTSYHPVWAVSEKNVLLEFDIYIPSKNLLIEYNGRQHYEYVQFFHKRLSNFVKQQKRDKRKEGMAIDNNYELVIFRFDDPITKSFVLSKLGRHRRNK